MMLRARCLPVMRVHFTTCLPFPTPPPSPPLIPLLPTPTASRPALAPGILQGIKSTGNRDAARAFRERWCFTEPALKADLMARTAHLPRGRGLIFSELAIVPGSDSATATGTAAPPSGATETLVKVLASGERAVLRCPAAFDVQAKFVE